MYCFGLSLRLSLFRTSCRVIFISTMVEPYPLRTELCWKSFLLLLPSNSLPLRPQGTSKDDLRPDFDWLSFPDGLLILTHLLLTNSFKRCIHIQDCRPNPLDTNLFRNEDSLHRISSMD